MECGSCRADVILEDTGRCPVCGSFTDEQGYAAPRRSALLSPEDGTALVITALVGCFCAFFSWSSFPPLIGSLIAIGIPAMIILWAIEPRARNVRLLSRLPVYLGGMLGAFAVIGLTLWTVLSTGWLVISVKATKFIVLGAVAAAVAGVRALQR